ncbi:MAG: phage minor head protein, partial [Sphaerochaetaceae bacterium]
MIDKIIKADEDELLFLLKNQVIDADATLETINNYEDELARILRDNLAYYIENIDEFDTIEQYYIARHNRAIAESPLATDISAANLLMVSNVIFEHVPAYYNEVDASLIIKAEDISLITKERFFNETTFPTLDFMTGWSEELGDLMNITTGNAVTDKVLQGLGEGKSIRWLEDQLSELPQFNRARARTTAITETLRAESYASGEAYMTSPVVTGLKWKHTGSRRNKPRPGHVALDGVVVPKGENFQIDGEEAPWPHHTSLSAYNVVNCHCLASPVTDPDITGLTADEKRELREQAIRDINADWQIQATNESINRINDYIDGLGSRIGGFIPAENKKQAVTFAKDKLGVQKASYAGLSVETANEINEAMFDFIQDYPELKGYVTDIQSVSAKSYQSRSVVQLNSTETGVRRILRFSKDTWDDIPAFSQKYADEVAAGWHPQGTTYIDTVKHELTHMLEANISEKLFGLLDDFSIEKWNDMVTGAVSVAESIVSKGLESAGITLPLSEIAAIRSISGYAMLNPHEALAEAMVKGQGPNADEITLAIIEAIEYFLRDI